MTFEAHVLHRLSSQHARISRAVRFVTARTALETHGSMLEGERTALIAVAGEATRFVGCKRRSHSRPDTPVGVVTVHATHGFLRKSVVIRTLELRPNFEMTARALLVHRGGLAHYQSVRPAVVDFVARCARDRIFGVAALQASDVRGLVQMATEANAIRSRSRQLRWIADSRGIRRLGVFLAGAVAGLAGVSGVPPLFVRLDHIVRALREGTCDVFMAGPARFRSGVRRRRLRPCSARSQGQTNEQ